MGKRGHLTPLHMTVTCVLRMDVANHLEKSLQRGRELLASHENRLIQDDTMPDSGHMLDNKRQELEVNLGSWDHEVLSLGSGQLPPSPNESEGPEGLEHLVCQAGSYKHR